MKFSKKLCKFISTVMSLCIMLVPISSMAADVENAQIKSVNFYTYADISKPDTRINASQTADISTLVLPLTVSGKVITLFCDSDATFRVKGALSATDFISGQSLDLNALCKDGEYLLEFVDNTSVYTLKILFESNIPSLYLISEDPKEQGREWVELSEDKSNKAKGSMIMISEDGEVIHSGNLTQIKGRGNTTWQLPKRPYQIKLEDKADLIRTGDDSNKSKTWVLLANYLDPVGIRNTLALNLGSALGMASNIQGESINLYYDGEYRGMYMLTEKVEVGSGRVDVADLEEENQNANPDKDIEKFPVAEGFTENGASYTYCEGMVSPADITGGYLLEMDYEVRALEEVCYIRTSRGNYVVVKSPEYASKEEMDYIATLYQEYEDSVFEGGVNSKTGKKYSDYVDVRSVACYYIINEFSKSRDCFSSSAYLSKKPGEDKLVMGPLWDYDMSFGKGSMEDYYADDDPYGISVRNTGIGDALFYIQEFRDVLTYVYKNDFEPLIENIVLGDEDAVSENGSLHSLKYYKNLLADSGHCNSALWYGDKSWDKEADTLYDFVSQRYDVLGEYFDKLSPDYVLPENEYYDVFSWEWHHDVIKKASQYSIMNGDGYGYFSPNDTVTRAQATQAIYNMSDAADTTYRDVYSDVRKDDWYFDAVLWATENEYFLGYPDRTFRPNSDITRESFVNFLYRFSGSPKVDTNLLQNFEDRELITAQRAIEWALDKGIIQGADNHINPKGAMTRAEMAAILVRYHETYKSSTKIVDVLSEFGQE